MSTNLKNHNPNRPKLDLLNKEGKYWRRFLPGGGLKVYLHFKIAHPDFDMPKTFRCTENDECPLCQKYQAAETKGLTDAWKLRAVEVFLYFDINEQDEFCYTYLPFKGYEALDLEAKAQKQGGFEVFDLNEGRLAELTLSKALLPEGKTQNNWRCSFNLGEKNSLSQKHRDTLKNTVRLEDLYKKYSIEFLTKIANGKSIKDHKGEPPASEAKPAEVARSEEDQYPQPEVNHTQALTWDEKKERIRRKLAEED